MKILYSIWDKGQGAFSRKEREGPKGFLPLGDGRAKCYKSGLEGWPRPKLPALQGSGETQAPLPRRDCRQPASWWGAGTCSCVRVLLVHSKQPVRLVGLLAQSRGQSAGGGPLRVGEGHSQVPPPCE